MSIKNNNKNKLKREKNNNNQRIKTKINECMFGFFVLLLFFGQNI